MEEKFFLSLAGSYIRSKLMISNISDIDAINIAKKEKIQHIYRFKKHQVVPRVKAIIDIVIHSNFKTILDVASQRGALLFPLIDQLYINNIDFNITSIDVNDDIINFLQHTSSDIDRFNVIKSDVTNLNSFKDTSYECIICSEILEHLENPMKAAKEMVRVSSNYIICSVPALPDENNEHIQLFYDRKQHDVKTISRQIQYKQTNLKHLWLDAGALSCKIRIINEPPYSILIAVVKV